MTSGHKGQGAQGSDLTARPRFVRGNTKYAEFGAHASTLRHDNFGPCAGCRLPCRLCHDTAQVDGRPQEEVQGIFFRSRVWGEGEPARNHQGNQACARRRPRPNRQAVQGSRQGLLPQGRQELQKGRTGLLVRRCVSWPADRQRRNLRYDASDGGASDNAAAELCPGDEHRKRKLGHRARQRPRALR